MNEEKKSTDTGTKKSSRATSQKSPGEKLKNATPVTATEKENDKDEYEESEDFEDEEN